MNASRGGDENKDEWLRRAVTAQREGRVEEAVRLCEMVISRHEDPAALNMLAVLSLGTGDRDRAAVSLERAARADLKSADLLINLAHVQRLRGDDAAERDALEQAIERAPNNLAANIRLAECLERSSSIVAASARWAVVLMLGGSVEKPSPQLAEILTHARAFVADQNRRFGDRIDGALRPLRATIEPSKTRRADAAIDHLLGRRGIYLNQCSGLHVPFLPAEEIFPIDLFPWLAPLQDAVPTIQSELRAALTSDEDRLTGSAPYVDLPSGIAARQWSALDKSTQWSAIHLWRDGVRDDDACARFPLTAAILDSLPLARLPHRMPTIFFSALAPKTHIPPHTGVTNARSIIHLPLLVPDNCRLRVGATTLRWHVGSPLAFDDTIEHEAWNDSDQLRVVLIMDAWNPYLSAEERHVISRFYEYAEQDSMAPNLVDRAWLG